LINFASEYRNTYQNNNMMNIGDKVPEILGTDEE